MLIFLRRNSGDGFYPLFLNLSLLLLLTSGPGGHSGTESGIFGLPCIPERCATGCEFTRCNLLFLSGPATYRRSATANARLQRPERTRSHWSVPCKCSGPMGVGALLGAGGCPVASPSFPKQPAASLVQLPISAAPRQLMRIASHRAALHELSQPI